METQQVWDSLSNLTIGTIVAWTTVIIAIISTICFGTIKLYKIFIQYKRFKDKEDSQNQIIEHHEQTLKEIEMSLRSIQKSLSEQKEVNLKQIRHTIVHTCEDALERGEISINKLRSLEEMYGEYVDLFHANGYVKTLVNRVRGLNIIGKSDE